MKETVRQNLMAALESGCYLQGRNALKYKDRKGQIRHCVGGVLCELYEQSTKGRRGKFMEIQMERVEGLPDETHENIRAIGGRSIFSILGHENVPPSRVLKWAAISDVEMDSMRKMNDEGSTFGQIARWLRTANCK